MRLRLSWRTGLLVGTPAACPAPPVLPLAPPRATLGRFVPRHAFQIAKH